MTLSSLLTPIVYVAVGLSWACAAILLRLANFARRRHVRSPALEERAQASFALAAFMTLLAVALANVDLGYPWLSAEGGRILVRLAGILPAWIPARWLYRYWRGWL